MNDWLKSFKISFLNKDIDTLIKLISEFDKDNFKNLDELNEASSLILEVREIFKQEQISLEGEIKKLQNVKRYTK
ncbi:hypothetical protein [Campylobacter pinnipediorum]|uniref:Uncharacterized protein n=1 Tax=Campylobacter pinnipediorum subsp. pinnipediorum TaxID=1660067 RepID=A0AAX0LC56_9BACT|nr:hypothetical protein [Campylobacter pinnipediorum]AQW81457.1 hypothetical protein CPIN17260_1170 [Campylobacter pinnipediorum subsp. pinnipediorum]AQW83085.1 hypothetical protein CPIN17261_1082 [Campylobacter pinnipediorum subsp. pinnipediorum]AQW84652.1 hypothetical protein CPIN17262_0975 [Campylobacter pinnipediorum subsp. pinnipediorum]OPA78294.1 hypothetical protein BFG05_03550 [Campylobacter pinnipediorum subsp. pinnipediorum]OPA81873.1 hypothetical protein BFG04_01660 [Campylobacter p